MSAFKKSGRTHIKCNVNSKGVRLVERRFFHIFMLFYIVRFYYSMYFFNMKKILMEKNGGQFHYIVGT